MTRGTPGTGVAQAPAAFMRFLASLIVAAALTFFARDAAADEKKEDKADEGRPKTAYLSFSPIHLTRPIVELTGEMRISPKWSVAVITGAGTIYRQAYWNAGMQLLAYPIGNFERGLQLGVETQYAGFAGGLPPNIVTGIVNTPTVAPLIGFKWTFSSFTISSQAGAAFAPLGESGRRFSSVYNLNVGWSF
jgi:hypothetical protein